MQSVAGSVVSTATEMEFASRLLEVREPAHLERVIDALLKRVASSSGSELDADSARRLRRQLLQSALRLGIPRLNRLRQAALRSPQVAKGAGALSRATRMLGVELEGMSSEDKEFEIARRFVRMSRDAVRQVHRPSSSCADPGSCSCSRCSGATSDISETANRSPVMHDIDHTKAEYDQELDELDEFELDEMETTDEYDAGELDEMESDAGEMDSGELDEFEYDETGSPFSEVEEAELAQELLGISSEGELDQFLGKLIKRAWRGASNLAKKVGVAKPLGGILKGVAKKLLPVAAGAAGTFFGGPAGAAIGSKIGSALGNALEMEFEGSPEDREFEAAKTFVQVAGKAAQQAVNAPPTAPPVAVAKNAVVNATRNHLKRRRHRGRNGRSNYGGGGYGGYSSGRRSGRWVRRGNKIIIFGV